MANVFDVLKERGLLAQTTHEEEIRELVSKYSSLIFRISYCILCNSADAEDAVQETFLRYLTKAPEFDKQVVNDDLEVAVAEVAEIVKNFIA